AKKLHLIYLEGYFDELDAKTIVVEKKYVDRDFLEDFAAYYVRSFARYERVCTRIHFFAHDFTPEEFEGVLQETPADPLIEEMQKSYLGFIVVKPIPITMIGRTCLRTYISHPDRKFPLIRCYHVNLFGIKLEVQSIPYQEQDRIVAACASSAIWSAFHSTAHLFQHQIPSPYEITSSATKDTPFSNRHFPNEGLTPDQMAYAIRSVHLEPNLIEAEYDEIVKATIYAYLKAGIPLVFGVQLFDESSKLIIGRHALTVVGYRLEGGTPQKFGPNDFYLSSSRIKKIYVHDDQVGPFARMEFDDQKVTLNTSPGGSSYDSLSTSWFNKSGQIGDIRAIPKILIIPLYHKIRIQYEVILNTIYDLDRLVKAGAAGIGKRLELEWDIFFSQLNDLKTEIFDDTNLPPDEKKGLLLAELPKYIWRASATTPQYERIEFLFDATDIEQGKLFLQIVKYSPQLNAIFQSIAVGSDLAKIDSLQIRAIFEALRAT
ncbi:MAG: hypothetical protein ABI444_00155, partial [Candidatus Kapaibacterium sp.]